MLYRLHASFWVGVSRLTEFLGCKYILFRLLLLYSIDSREHYPMHIHNNNDHTPSSQSPSTKPAPSRGRVPIIIPTKSDPIRTSTDPPPSLPPVPPVFSLPLPSDQSIIPGYNFQSLFRKKSHIRLARKKHKQQSQRRCSSTQLKACPGEKEQKNIQKGHWTAQENKRYHWFLEIHSRHFIFKHLRRTDKIFKNMAAFIATREAEQCRSHHQKMEKKYHTFYQILLKLRNEFYQAAGTDDLKAELEEAGFVLKDPLICEQQLKNGQARGQLRREQDQAQSLNSDSHSSPSSKHQNNLLNENYENNLDFHIPY